MEHTGRLILNQQLANKAIGEQWRKGQETIRIRERIQELLGVVCTPKEVGLDEPSQLQNAIDALIKIGNPAIEPTIDALRNNPKEVWGNLRKVLVGIGANAIPSLGKTISAEQDSQKRKLLIDIRTEITGKFGHLRHKSEY